MHTLALDEHPLFVKAKQQVAAAVMLAGIGPLWAGKPFSPLVFSRVQLQVGEQRLGVASEKSDAPATMTNIELAK